MSCMSIPAGEATDANFVYCIFTTMLLLFTLWYSVSCTSIPAGEATDANFVYCIFTTMLLLFTLWFVYIHR